MKQLFLHIIFPLSATVYGQGVKNDYRYKNYDSVVVQTLDDLTYEHDFKTGERLNTIIITGQATLTTEDAKEFNRIIRQKDSYGQSQASTPVYDLGIIFYKKGKVKEEILINLWTNDLFATFPLRVQRQGECMCSGNGGYCCSEGGISINFKKYLLDLLEKYNLPNDREEILNFGQ
ncbi:MAG: hypothetical protein M9916_00120 [Crocinitomicaceae bacterium]|nr:hypothetical protein [Crocinitomicaceae bacterium]